MLILKKILVVITVLMINVTSFNCVKAESEYSVVDNNEVIDTFTSFNKANNFYNLNKDNYDNLLLLEGNKIIKMEYGVVEFIKDDKSINTIYTSLVNGESYLNSYYATDGAYLYSNKDASKVYFKIAGDTGYVSIDKVNLVPIEDIKYGLTSYTIIDDLLYFNIKTDLNNTYFTYSYAIDKKLDYLENNKVYYSYDNHYFYDDFKTMIDDYVDDTNKNSINNENPYYNYYMYLPHRSYTNYNLAEVEDYFYNYLSIDGKIQFYDDLNRDSANDDVNLSQIYDELDSFFGYEEIYGSNAMMMLALSCNESAYGKSYLAFYKNNLFGHAAYDSDPERNASRYKDVSTSIYAHAKYYISRLYAGVHSSVYKGSFFGDKLSGMNVNYASDPYWSIKAISNYFKFDSYLGFKDLNSYAIGIIENNNNIKVYNNEDLSDLSFKVTDTNNYSFIILEELDESYKIQVDASYNSEYLYDPEISIGYIDKDLVDYIINEDKITNKEYKTVTFDLGEEVIEVKILKDKIPSIYTPNKEGYEFIGFDKELNDVDTSYTALYKEIEKIEVVSNFNNEIETNYFYNLKGGKIKVTYKDNSTKVLDINSNMIENYDSTVEGESHITINYCGVKVEYPVTFSSEISKIRETLQEKINNNINSYLENQTYNLDDIYYIKDNLMKVDYQTSFADIRYIDKMLLENTRDYINYNLKDSNYDLSISGLALALKDPIKTISFKPFKDTYYIEVKDIDDSALERLTKVANAYGFTVEDSLKISVKLNLQVASFSNPIIFQIKLQDKKDNKIYTVYHLDEDNNVIKCYTTQSDNYIQFMTRSEGNFVVLSKDSVNTYDFEDVSENISILNADEDNHLLFFEGILIVVTLVFGVIMIVGYKLLKKKEEEIWNDYKKSLQKVELPQEEKLKN